MMKRVLLFGGAAMLLGSVILLIWQPDSLKTRLINTVAREVSKTQAYDLGVGRVTGNIFTGFTLHDVRLLIKSDRSEIVYAKAIHFGIGWWALAHGTIRVHRLNWIEPTVRLTIDRDGHLALPRTSRTADEDSGSPLRYSIRELTVENGRFIVETHAHGPVQELIFRDIALSAKVSTRHVAIDSFKSRFQNGTLSLHGGLVLEPALSGEFVIDDQNFPLDPWLAAAGSAAAPFPLVHSGQWTVHADTQAASVTMKGRLADAPIALDGTWTPAGVRNANLTWTKPSLFSATIHLTDGAGMFQLTASSSSFKAAAQGTLNLPKRSIEGTATADQILWHDAAAHHVEATFSADARHQRLAVQADGVQFHREAGPFDIPSGRISLDGASPRWASDMAFTFRNGSTMALTGALARAGDAWKVTWQRLVMTVPNAGTWTAKQPGSLQVGSRKQIEIRDLSLSNGNQSVEIPQADTAGKFPRFTMDIHNLDPGPWVKLVSPKSSLKSASVNAHLQRTDGSSESLVDGFVNGKAASFEDPVFGLNIRTVELDISATHGKIDIKKFSGKVKKGEVSVTGGAVWPALDYSLHTREFSLKSETLIKAAGDVDLHLGGTADYPSLTGVISIKEAIYSSATGKKKPETPAASAPAPAGPSLWLRSEIDVSVRWPRNVWYREGVSNIETQGDVRLQKSKEKPDVIVTGSVHSVRGTYNYFGRDFAIESGEIKFPGTPEFNPLINVEASYHSDPTVVYLDITGTLKQPVLKLRSNPALSEQDIVSVIVFGQPLNQLRSQGGSQTSNQQMLQAAGGVLGSYVTKELRELGLSQLNVDVLNLQATPQGNQLTVGRYLTRRLFISYGQAVRGSAGKSITADYFLTDKWTLQGASDSVQGNYLDFLFRYPLKRGAAVANTSSLPASPFRNTLDVTNPQQPTFAQ